MTESHVLMGFDGNYAMPAAVAIASLGRTLEPGQNARIHVLGVGLSKDDKRRIGQSATDRTTLEWYEFDDALISDLPTSSVKGELYITRTAYTLLFLDRYLPPDIERLLFVDADTLVRRSPLQLLQTDLGGRALGAVRDFGCSAVAMPGGVTGWRELGLDGRSPALNSGLLLIDREAWRANGIEQRSLDYLARFGSGNSYVDQDCLNATNAGAWLELEPTWNYQTHIEWAFGGDAALTYAFLERHKLDEARRDPAVVHYAGSIKPWQTEGETLPFIEEWQWTLDGTAWSGTRPEPPAKPSKWKAVRYRLRKAYEAAAGR